MRGGFEIKNKQEIIDFFSTMITTNSFTFEVDLIFEEGCVVVTDRARQERELIQIQLAFADSPSMDEDSTFSEDGQDYVMTIYRWNAVPILSNSISSNNNDDLDLSAISSTILSCLSSYNSNQSNAAFNAAKYSIDTDSSILAQTNAVTKVLVTPRAFEKSRDLSTTGLTLKTEAELEALEASRKSSRESALASWKITNSWS